MINSGLMGQLAPVQTGLPSTYASREGVNVKGKSHCIRLTRRSVVMNEAINVAFRGFVCPLIVAIIFVSFPDISKLSAIKDRLPAHVSYGHIKLVIAILELSCGAFSQGTPAEPQSQRSFKFGTQPMRTPSKPAPASQETARKLPGWLSGNPGGKRKNPF